ncbi:hypothetical protein BDZ91DRAFT_724064 [Kalaharituber pfeilii]|nr:hypothetical protein BDZ91DRAFT_724064 [Kalaharituber pfeilii]
MAHTAPMNYAPQPPPPPQHAMPPPMLVSAPTPLMIKKLLPPRHDTASSLTNYLSHILKKATASIIPPMTSTSFTLPWEFGIPRHYVSMPTSPGAKFVTIRDYLYRLSFQKAHTEATDNSGGEEKDKTKELEALVSMAKQSMDIQNCLTEIANSIVRIVQGVDGFTYVLSSANRVPSDGPVGMLGGNWEFTFVCNASDEYRTLRAHSRDREERNGARAGSEGREQSTGQNKYYACQGRLGISFLEREETTILRYRHSAIHRPTVETTIVGGVVSRKPPPNGITSYAPPVVAATHATSADASLYAAAQNGPPAAQSQNNGYVQVNGQWYYPHPHAQHYPQTIHPAPPAPPQQQQATIGDPLPEESMVKIYSQAISQYQNQEKDTGLHSVSMAPTTEQRLYESLSRELNTPRPPQPQPQQQQQEQTQQHQQGQPQVQVQTQIQAPSPAQQQPQQQQPVTKAPHEHPHYPYPSATAYSHSAVAPLAGGSDIGNREAAVAKELQQVQIGDGSGTQKAGSESPETKRRKTSSAAGRGGVKGKAGA